MSEETTNAENTAAAGGGEKMPTFLKVLCILSFIGTGIGIISGIMGYFTYSALAAVGGGMMDSLTEAMEGMEGAEEMGAAMDMMGIDPAKQATASILQAVLCIVVLIGVIMMWKRKKTGFYIYTISNLAYAFVPLVIVGGLVGMMGTVSVIFAIAFIIMYALNLKHMS